MDYELKYMYRCLQLAEYGSSYVAPNPMVGAVLVCNDFIIGEGYHQRYGQPHAEPNAINSVLDKELLKSSTLYVNLEPCSHFGKTPPCADLIVNSGIPKVVIGTYDPNPKVSGKGVEILRKAGIEVIISVLEKECRELNKHFFVFQEKKRPFVLLKWAQTLDGFIDNNRNSIDIAPLQISNKLTRQYTHHLRSQNQSILVGTQTVMLDNPSLTVRFWSGKTPIRIALDRQGRISEDFNLLDGKIATLIFTEQHKKSSENVEFIQIRFDSDFIANFLKELFNRNINSVLVEGGSQLINSFIDATSWDEANVEISNFYITNGVKAPKIPTLPFSMKTFNNHKWLNYRS